MTFTRRRDCLPLSTPTTATVWWLLTSQTYDAPCKLVKELDKPKQTNQHCLGFIHLSHGLPQTSLLCYFFHGIAWNDQECLREDPLVISETCGTSSVGDRAVDRSVQALSHTVFQCLSVSFSCAATTLTKSIELRRRVS